MGAKTEIAWTESTWNPVSGCSPVSPGCDRCYARRLAKRLPASHAVGHSFSEVVCHPERLDVPLRWRKPKRIFVCSMGDLFHESVPFGFIEKVWAVMLLAPQHTFQVLTKRPDRMKEFLARPGLYHRVLHHADGFRFGLGKRGLFNVGVSNPKTRPARWIWLGVTAEDQQRADERIPLLLQCPAAVRFVSCEPLLGPIDFEHIGNALFDRARAVRHRQYGPSCLNEEQAEATTAYPELSWLIAGGESGPGARPMHPAWARSLRDQCKAAGVPFLFKQVGEWALKGVADDVVIRSASAFGVLSPDGQWYPGHTGWNGRAEDPDTGEAYLRRVGKRAAGRLLDGATHDEYPEAAP